MTRTKPNLTEAQTALEKLLPHLPWPRLTEHMNCCGFQDDGFAHGRGGTNIDPRPGHPLAIPAFTKRSSGGLRHSIVVNGPLSGAFFGLASIPVRCRMGEPQMKG
jgi:hypothetical protein